LSWVALILTMTWLAIQCWWWARIGLDSAIREQKSGQLAPVARRRLSEEQYRVAFLPRIYALAVFAAVAISFLFQGEYWLAAIAGIFGVAVFTLLWKRRNILKCTVSDRNIRPIRTVTGKAMLATSYLFVIVTMWWVWVDPVGAGFLLGSLSISAAGLASIVPVLSLVTVSNTLSRAPVLTTLAGLVVLLGSFSALDHHQVRVILEETTSAPRELAKVYEEWKSLDNHQSNQSLIVVYAAGGGIRAAYWTALSLAKLEDTYPGIHRNIFAISGVSGGSVGAAFWLGALAQQQRSGTTDQRKLFDQMDKALSKDYLAPTLGALLYKDLAYALIGFLPFVSREDRAAVLEQSWEKGFKDTVSGEEMSEDFLGLWPDQKAENKDWLPLLLSNGTHQETGRRIITAPILIKDGDFLNALDFFALTGKGIRLSTAALNSARFTYVSPAGTLESPNREKVGHILDGGYFENSGARTAIDLANSIRSVDENQRIVLVEIMNDPAVSEINASREPDESAPTTIDVSEKDMFSGVINEVVAPIGGLLATREGRGHLEAKLAAIKSGAVNLRDQSEAQSPSNVDYVLIRMCMKEGKQPPLGWVLNSRSTEAIKALFDQQVTDDDKLACNPLFGLKLIAEAAGYPTNQ